MKKLKELILKLPGLSAPEPKHKKIAILVYSLVLFLWLFAITILIINYNYSTGKSEEEIKTKNMILAIKDGVETKPQGNSLFLNSSDIITENKNSGLLVNTPSVKNNFNAASTTNSSPSNNLSYYEQTPKLSDNDRQLLEKLSIRENTFSSNKYFAAPVKEISPIQSPLKAPEDTKSETLLTKESDGTKLSVPKPPIIDSEIKKEKSLSEEKISFSKNSVSVKTNVTKNTVSSKNQISSKPESVTKKSKNKLSIKENNDDISTSSSALKQSPQIIKPAIKPAVTLKSTGQSQQRQNHKIESYKTKNQVIPTDLKNKKSSIEENDANSKRVLTSGMEEYQDKKEVIINPEKDVTNLNLNNNNKINSELKNMPKKENSILLKKYDGAEYSPLKER